MLAAFLGFAKGASERYSENIDLQAKREASLLKRMTESKVAHDNIARSDASYTMTPTVQLLSGVRTSIAPGVDIMKQAEVLLQQDHNAGVPSFYVPKDFDAIQKVGKLLQPDMHLINPEDYTKDEATYQNLQEYDAALISALADLYEGGETKNEVSGATIDMQDVTGKIPGFNDFTPEKKEYVIEKASQALGTTPEVARFLELVPNTRPIVHRNEGSTKATYIPRQVTLPTGETRNVDSEEAIAEKQSVMSVAEQARTNKMAASDYADFVYTQVYTLADGTPGFEAQQGFEAINSLNFHFGTNINVSATGKLSSAPFQVQAIRQDLDPVYNKIGFGNTVKLMAFAMPANATYKGGAVSSVDLASVEESRIKTYKAKVMGLDSQDKIAAFDNKLGALNALQTNVKELSDLIAIGEADLVGTPQQIVNKLQVGLDNAMKTLTSRYGIGAGVQENIAAFTGELEKLTPASVSKANGTLDVAALQRQKNKLVELLTNQLAYNVARSLESSTGNARLSNIDVENAKNALGLTGLLATPDAALAVLSLISARTQKEIEYMNATGSDDLKIMQSAHLLQQMTGTDSMLRVAGLNDASGINGLIDFRNQLNEELGRSAEFKDVRLGSLTEDTQEE